MRLAGLNVWTSNPESVARMLVGALGLGLRGRATDHGREFSGRIDDLMVSVHHNERCYTELAFIVEAIEPAIAACEECGSRVIEGLTRLPYGISAHLAGPGDLRIELVERLPTTDLDR